MEGLRDEERVVEGEDSDQSDTDSSSSKDTSRATHGAIATPHSYLGEVDDIACSNVFLEEGSVVTIPLFYIEGMVLFPGATLPMRILNSPDKAALEFARHCEEAPCTLGVVHRSRVPAFQHALVGTTAEIKQLRYVADGSVNIITKGFQRFRTVHVWENADGVVCAQVCILSEDLPLHIPRDAFGKLACVLNFRSGKDHSALLEQQQNELKLLKESNSVGFGAILHLESSHDGADNRSSRDVHSEVEAQECRPREDEGNGRTANMRQTHHDRDSSISSGSPKDDSSSGPVERGESYQKRWALDASKCLSMGQCSTWPHWVYRMHDAYNLARHAADLWQQVVELPSIYSLVRRPQMLAYHIASRIPVQDSTRQELLEIDGVVYRLRREIQLLESLNNLKCKWCLELIARRSDILVMSAEGPVDAFVNNHGVVHEILTLLYTNGLILLGNPETEYSWFPGYSWTVAFCSVCKAHMGWLYRAVKRGLHPKLFWGIRRSQLA